jgi:hypothetical protein
MARKFSRPSVILLVIGLMLFIGLPSFLLVKDVQSRRSFDAFAAEIEALGGVVKFFPNEKLVDRCMDILRGRNPQFEQTIGVLNLRGCNISDSWLSKCSQLRGVELLILDNTPVTDASIASLAGMVEMKSLHLAETAVTDAGLMHLSRMQNLEELDLSGTQMVGWGLRHLCDKRKLTYLHLNDIQTLDATQLGDLACIPSLEALELRGRHIDDQVMAHVERMPSLNWLDISETNVGTAGLQALAPLSGRLKQLALFGTHVTDEGTEAIVALKPRRVLVPHGMSDQAVEELRRRLPTSDIATETEIKGLAAGSQAVER